MLADLREQENCRAIVDQKFDEVYQLAADMGGAGFIFTGENDADIMHNSALINSTFLKLAESAISANILRPLRASIRSTTRRTRVRQSRARTAPIQQILTANMDGKSCFRKEYT